MQAKEDTTRTAASGIVRKPTARKESLLTAPSTRILKVPEAKSITIVKQATSSVALVKPSAPIAVDATAYNSSDNGHNGSNENLERKLYKSELQCVALKEMVTRSQSELQQLRQFAEAERYSYECQVEDLAKSNRNLEEALVQVFRYMTFWAYDLRAI
jgi:hypothetical protein